MMKKIEWMLLLCAAMILGSTSCSDDNTPGDPEGTTMLNMLDEQNGKTMLEDSGIYIDRGQNFISGSNCDLFVIGKCGGLGTVRINAIQNTVSRAAVQTGCGYVAVRPAALLRFPSGAQALPIGHDANYVKFWVVSPITSENKTTGAAIKYAIISPETYGLPEFGSTAYTIDLDAYDHLEQEVSYKLPTSDFEYDFRGDETISCEKRGNRLVFKLHDWSQREYTLLLRIRESYTQVKVEVR